MSTARVAKESCSRPAAASTRDASGGLRCEVLPDREVVRVLAVGELDLATVNILDQTVSHLLEAGFTRLELDLRRLEFIDSTGIHLIVRFHQTMTAEGGKMTVIPGLGQVQRVLELTGVLDHLQLADSVSPPFGSRGART